MMPEQQYRNTKKGKRQHPLWIIFSIGKSIKEVIIPIIYFFVIQMDSDSLFIKYGSLALLAYMIYRIISILFSWKNYKYILTDKNIEIIDGRLKKEKRYISLDRIQSVQQNTSFFHRIVGLTSLTLLTGATDDNASAKLEVISHPEAEKIQKQLKLSYSIQENELEPNIEDDTSEHASLMKHYEMTIRAIVKASFTSFYFLALIPVLLTIYIKLDQLFSIEDYTESTLSSLNLSWIMITVMIALTLILSAGVGVLFVYFKYGNFRVSSDHERIFINKGVFSQTDFSIPKNKVNAIKFNKSFIRRWFKMVEVELVSAGGFGEEELQTNILFPFISERRAKCLVPEVLPAFQVEENMTKLPRPAFFVNLFRPSYFWIIVTAVIFYFWPERWYIPIGLLILIIVSRIIEFQHSSYALNDAFIQLQSGSISTEFFLTTRKKVDELEITESWVQRKLGLATLKISTRSKPILVSTIDDIPKEMAVHYYNWYADR